jgi:hypothetical protein
MCGEERARLGRDARFDEWFEWNSNFVGRVDGREREREREREVERQIEKATVNADTTGSRR